MATNGLDVKVVSIPLGTSDWVGDDAVGHIMQAPSDAQGGGLTILSASIVNAAATGAGTGFAFQIENWGTAGTAVAGTIAAAVGGTADPFVANTPRSFAISSAFVDAGEWIVARKTETNSSDPIRGVLVLQYVIGK